MALTLEVLPWDSEFLGVPIGRVDLDGADTTSIAAVESQARDQGIRCLYASLDPIDAQLTWHVQTLGYRFVD